MTDPSAIRILEQLFTARSFQFEGMRLADKRLQLDEAIKAMAHAGTAVCALQQSYEAEDRAIRVDPPLVEDQE